MKGKGKGIEMEKERKTEESRGGGDGRRMEGKGKKWNNKTKVRRNEKLVRVKVRDLYVIMDESTSKIRQWLLVLNIIKLLKSVFWSYRIPLYKFM